MNSFFKKVLCAVCFPGVLTGCAPKPLDESTIHASLDKEMAARVNAYAIDKQYIPVSLSSGQTGDAGVLFISFVYDQDDKVCLKYRHWRATQTLENPSSGTYCRKAQAAALN